MIDTITLQLPWSGEFPKHYRKSKKGWALSDGWSQDFKIHPSGKWETETLAGYDAMARVRWRVKKIHYLQPGSTDEAFIVLEFSCKKQGKRWLGKKPYGLLTPEECIDIIQLVLGSYGYSLAELEPKSIKRIDPCCDLLLPTEKFYSRGIQIPYYQRVDFTRDGGVQYKNQQRTISIYNKRKEALDVDDIDLGEDVTRIEVRCRGRTLQTAREYAEPIARNQMDLLITFMAEYLWDRHILGTIAVQSQKVERENLEEKWLNEVSKMPDRARLAALGYLTLMTMPQPLHSKVSDRNLRRWRQRMAEVAPGSKDLAAMIQEQFELTFDKAA